MARARKGSSKKGTVKVNFKDMESRTRVGKEGDYPLKVVEAINDKSGAGNDQISVTFEVSKGEFKGSKAWMHFPLIENSLWKLHAFLTALGQEVPDEEMDIDLSELVDGEIVGVFTPDTYNGKRSFKMTDFQSMEDYKGSDDEDDDDDKKSSKKSKKDAGKKGSKKEAKDEAPDYSEMEDDELRDLYVERDLGTKKAAKKLDEDELIEALEEADAAAAKSSKGSKKSKKDDDDEDEKPSKKSKKDDKKSSKKKPKKIAKSDVEDMDEDELQELIDEHDLDVDLDEYKKLPKKVAAVVDALEEGDLLEDDD